MMPFRWSDLLESCIGWWKSNRADPKVTLIAIATLPLFALLLGFVSNVAATDRTSTTEATTSPNELIQDSSVASGDETTPVNLEVAQASPLESSCAAGQEVATDSTAKPSDRLTELLNWAVSPETSFTSLVSQVGPVVAAQLAARPFPEIQERARLSRVPVLMYHDILAEKEVFFDVTPEEFEAHLKLIQQNGLHPISLDQLVAHLSTGVPLPEKPVLLTFDDGYAGHYTYVYPLLRKYGYPGTFAIYTDKVGRNYGRSSLTWDQLREMAADPLVTIASHSLSHPRDLGDIPDQQLRREVVESKRILEEQLGIPIDHFVYPEGNYNDRVKYWVQLAGYHSALTMNDDENKFAGESNDLLSIERIGQSQIAEVITQVYGGPPLPTWGTNFNFNNPVQVNQVTLEGTPLILISGGKPITIHADSRYQVPEIISNTRAIAAVDGGFFSLKYLDSNVMIGPVLSQNTETFTPGNASENPRLNKRPLVLISDSTVKFVPFDAALHNTLEGVQTEMADVTDAFVAAAWLVKDSQPQPDEAFGTLFDFNAARHRAFWGIDQTGQPVIGVSVEPIGSVDLGKLLAQAGFRDAVMLDSGASTSLAYQGESLVGYLPRPVPHVVALVPPEVAAAPGCALVSDRRAKD
ncbi:MAG: polysaccharide deacetylase family protein [Oculatellaceae cyanobacterium bins.114]|nr:polysaccharide deacetylase family protein [Oculatellaceae cyanobacterium bins.114]